MTEHGSGSGAFPIGLSDPPLKGVRILSVEQYGAGPFASLYLADMGAEIIKIESPVGDDGKGGDSSRQSGPHFLGDNDSHFFQNFNLGKRSLTLDIRSVEGREIFRKLAAGADGVLNNLRGDQPAKLGLDHAALADVKPSLVCAHLSGYGRAGPRVSWPAYDYLMQAEAGYLSLTGEPDGPPSRMGLSIVDYLTGITTAFALTAGLYAALRTGRGRDIDVTLYDVAMHQLSYPAVWYMNEAMATTRRPRSGHPFVVPCEVFPTADGHIFLMCVLEKFWRNLCTIIGQPALPEDPLFATPKARFQNRDVLVDILDRLLATRTTAEWMTRFAGAVPAAPILSMADALDNPYFSETAGIQSVEHPARPGLRVLSSPIRIDGARPLAKPAPLLGADTDEILSGLGYDSAAIAALRARRVV